MVTMKDELYNGLDAEFYDELLDGELDDLPFWSTLLKQVSSPALEVGCGTGRVLIPMLREGFSVDGIDNSSPMVKRLGQKASRLKLKTDVRIQSMETMELQKKYSFIFIPGFSLQMVASRPLILQSLEQFNRHLDSGGLLAVSLFFPWEEMEEQDPGHWRLRKKVTRSNGIRLECRQAALINLVNQSLILKNRYTLLDQNQDILSEETRDIRLLWFYPHEFHLLLQESGFQLLETYSDFKFEPMDAFTPHAVFLAQKV